MKYIYLLILFVAFSCIQKNDNEASKPEEIVTIFDKRKFFEDENKTKLEFHITQYVDSLHHLRQEEALPAFFNDLEFDTHHSTAWPTLHSPISVRAHIINRINKCWTLDLLLQSKNPNLKAKPKHSSYFDIPKQNLSWYDLALIRKKQLECK